MVSTPPGNVSKINSSSPHQQQASRKPRKGFAPHCPTTSSSTSHLDSISNQKVKSYTESSYSMLLESLEASRRVSIPFGFSYPTVLTRETNKGLSTLKDSLSLLLTCQWISFKLGTSSCRSQLIKGVFHLHPSFRLAALSKSARPDRHNLDALEGGMSISHLICLHST